MIKYFVIRNFRGTRSFVEMLKGYMVREILGTPGLKSISVSSKLQNSQTVNS